MFVAAFRLDDDTPNLKIASRIAYQPRAIHTRLHMSQSAANASCAGLLVDITSQLIVDLVWWDFKL